MEWIITAITLGLLGSFHCVGMCGPIALALPLKKNSQASALVGAIIYNGGRVVTYALLGGIFGGIGKSFFIAGYQQLLSILLGVALLIIILLPLSWKRKLHFNKLTYPFIGRLKHLLGQLLTHHNYNSLFLIGFLNGWLPCGLVYVAIAGATATGSLLNGSLFMAIFGLGTFPVMLAIPVLKNTVSIKMRSNIRKIVPVFVIMMGILLVLRGMNLGIPYISPSFSGEEEISCCHKH